MRVSTQKKGEKDGEKKAKDRKKTGMERSRKYKRQFKDKCFILPVVSTQVSLAIQGTVELGLALHSI